MSLWQRLKQWFLEPPCPRVERGYQCHEYLPDGCGACGRGKK